MDEEKLYQAIFKRKSVRKYESGPLDEGTLSKIAAFLKSTKPMHPEVRTEIRVMENAQFKGMFKADAPHFLAIFSEEKEGYLSNAGFILQQVDLYLSSIGIGSCWQGGPKPVKGVDSPSGTEFVIAMAFGRPAESAHRNDISEFKREPIAKITSIEGKEDLLEAARLAPSGINNQPWYFTGEDGTIDAYSAKSIMVDKMNRISTGIALCHIWLAALHAGKKVEFITKVSTDIKTLKGYSYVISLKVT